VAAVADDINQGFVTFLQLATEPESKNQRFSSPRIVTLIWADDLHPGELNREVEAMNWQRVTDCEFKFGGK
jgi:hypothetical protein